MKKFVRMYGGLLIFHEKTTKRILLKLSSNVSESTK